MKETLVEPKISERFDIDDIRKIRDYNAARHAEMSAKDIVDEIREHTKVIVEGLSVKPAR